jgi:DNA-binding transcriptional LysR family regulator
LAAIIEKQIIISSQMGSLRLYVLDRLCLIRKLFTMVDLRHFRYFQAVAEELNFTKAAKRLHIAQPPLSVQIRDLEAAVGVPLFDRSSRPLQLTAAGAFLQAESRQILTDVDSAIEEARRLGRGPGGWIGIGFISASVHGFLPDLLRQYRRRNPKIEVVLRQMTAPQQVDALRARQIHVGFIRPSLDTEEFAQCIVFPDTLSVACPEDHALTRMKSIPLSALKGEALIAYDGGLRPGFTETLVRICRSAGFEPRITMRVDQPVTALGAVAAGFGISLVATSLYGDGPRGFRIIPIAPPAPPHPIYVVHRRGEASDAFQKLQELMPAALAHE